MTYSWTGHSFVLLMLKPVDPALKRLFYLASWNLIWNLPFIFRRQVPCIPWFGPTRIDMHLLVQKFRVVLRVSNYLLFMVLWIYYLDSLCVKIWSFDLFNWLNNQYWIFKFPIFADSDKAGVFNLSLWRATFFMTCGI